MLGAFERCRFGEAENAVLRGDVSALEWRCDEGVGRCDVDDAAPLFRLHAREGEARGVEGGRQVQRDDEVPFRGREVFHRRDVLNACIVDEDIDGAELLLHGAEHCLDLVGLRHVGVGVEAGDVVLSSD